MMSIKINDLNEMQLKRKLFLTGLLNVSWLTITFLLLLNLLLCTIIWPSPKHYSNISVYLPLISSVVGLMYVGISPIRYIIVSRNLTLPKLKRCMIITFLFTALYSIGLGWILLFRHDFFVIFDEVMDHFYVNFIISILLCCWGLWIISFLILLFFWKVFLARPELLRQGEQYSLELLKKFSMKRLYFLFAVKRFPAVFLWIARVSFWILCLNVFLEFHWSDAFVDFEWLLWVWGISLAITILSSIFSWIYFRLNGCRFPVSVSFLKKVISESKNS